jgi:predicted TPR repeat methyltransferase
MVKTSTTTRRPSSAASLPSPPLARTSGLDATFVRGDARELPQELRNRFDLVFASYGALIWIGDLDAWMRSARAALRAGGSS